MIGTLPVTSSCAKVPLQLIMAKTRHKDLRTAMRYIKPGGEPSPRSPASSAHPAASTKSFPGLHRPDMHKHQTPANRPQEAQCETKGSPEASGPAF